MPKRLFGFFSGSTPTQFLLRARINHAQQLLSESTLSVRAIAQGLGYGDIYFFSRQFKSK